MSRRSKMNRAKEAFRSVGIDSWTVGRMIRLMYDKNSHFLDALQTLSRANGWLLDKIDVFEEEKEIKAVYNFISPQSSKIVFEYILGTNDFHKLYVLN